MATLGAVDPNSFRKSRRNSMMMLASQLNLNQIVDSSDVKDAASIGGASGVSRKHSESSNIPQTGEDAIIRFTSALYGKLLVFLGLAFPIAEYFSQTFQSVLYNGFYIYLYFGSICFILFSYTILLRSGKQPLRTVIRAKFYDFRMFLKPYQPKFPDIKLPEQLRHLLPNSHKYENKTTRDGAEPTSSSDESYTKDVESNIIHEPKPSKFVISEASHGSMYLKVGTVLFGIGSMIYSGLEFGTYFELRADCANLLMAIAPVARMVFTFLQMYYIFLYSRASIGRHTTIARYGLMHMVATNLCIWINVLVEETKHTLHHLAHHDEHHDEHHESDGHGSPIESSAEHHSAELLHMGSESFHGDMSDKIFDHGLSSESYLGPIINNTLNQLNITSTAYQSTFAPTPKLTEGLFDSDDIFHNLVKRAADVSGCRTSNLLGDLVASSSPLLFPCTIEYSLLCAGVIYVMWTNVISPSTRRHGKDAADTDSEISHIIARKFRHHYSVDCSRASRGMFVGIFVLVLTIISLILFIVLVNNRDFKNFAILQANFTEMIIYTITTVTCVIGMRQMRELSYHAHHEVELDNILLLIAQAGVYVFSSFTLVSGLFTMQSDAILPMVKSVFALTQTTVQTLLILGGSQRVCRTAEQLADKPGREMVTFLLVSNLAMWAISTFQTSKSIIHPTQLAFFGKYAWTIIAHISMPLAIFYRFHATVCLGEIWKKSYKLAAS